MATTSHFQVLKRLSKDSVVYGFGRLLPKASAIVLMPIYTAYLVPADYGILALAGMIAAMVAQLMLLGQVGTLVRFHRPHQREHSAEELAQLVFSVVVAVLLFGAGVLALLLAVGPWALPRLLTSDAFTFHPFLTVALVATFCSLPMNLLLGIFRATGQPGRHTLLQIGRFAISTVFALYFVVALGQGALGSLKGGIYSAVILLPLAGVLLVRRMRGRFSASLLKQALVFGLPLVPHFFAGWILTFSDRYILEQFTSLDEVGFYSLAFNVALVMSMIAGSANTALAPIYYDLMSTEEGRKAVPRITTLFAAGVTMVAIGILLFARELLLILAAERYAVAAGVVPILVAGYYLQGMYFVLTKGIIYAKRTGLLPVVSVGAAVVNIGLNLWLIPRYGMYAAAWTTVVSFGLMALAARWMSGRLVQGIFQDGALIRIVLIFVAAYLANHFVAALGWGLAATLGVKVVLLVVILGAFLVLRVITRAELRGLAERLSGRKKGRPSPPTDGADADMDGPPPVQ